MDIKRTLDKLVQKKTKQRYLSVGEKLFDTQDILSGEQAPYTGHFFLTPDIQITEYNKNNVNKLYLLPFFTGRIKFKVNPNLATVTLFAFVNVV